MKPRLLDLFCGAGGAARGYQEAGFYVVGVDVKPQPRYAGDEFHQADAMTFPLEGFDAIHASPPCQAHSSCTQRGRGKRSAHADLIPATRARLRDAGAPYVIENVVGAPLNRGSVMLCGSMFGLDVRRHRLFELGGLSMLVQACRHGVFTKRFQSADTRMSNAMRVCPVYGSLNFAGDLARRQQAMGIDWMPNRELVQAIPPAYTRYIGRQLIAQLAVTP